MTDLDQTPSDGLPAAGAGRAELTEHSRTGMGAAALQRAIADHLRYSIGRPAAALRPEHYYRALALAVRDRMQDRRVASTQVSLDLGRKVTCYLSAEFLMGPQLGNNLLNLRMERAARQALSAMGQNFDEVLACEEEPGLGNGGLGRLAACYLDSLATLERPAISYGIRYEFGIFDQEIHDGWQVEQTDNWLDSGNPWEIAKPDVNYLVKWGGYVEHYTDDRIRFLGDNERVRRMSLIGEDTTKFVRMAHLATVGSHAVNGVAALHTELLKDSVLKDFYEMWPERFSNKTNGVTPRRFLALANPGLRELLDRTIGEGWLTDLGRLRGLEQFVDDSAFREQWRDIKRNNKARLASFVRSATGVELNPEWIFDIQVKRIHEYKRQHLNVLHIVALYYRLKQNPSLSIPPRAFIFGGKAAPGYFLAKRIIKLINAVAETINNDPDVNKFLKVAFIPNFNVQNAHLIYPAANVSEQISTAGKEASGTGNMKFMINGALTVGTLDGANVEIREEAGPKNFFLFGLTVPEVQALKASGYRPTDYIDGNEELSAVLDLIEGGTFSHGDHQVFRPLVDNLGYHDSFLVCADFASYVQCQERVSHAWQDRDAWTKMSILNTARSGKFSSDRAIAEYCEDIWKVWPLTVKI